MSSGTPGAQESESGRIGGARADFVASLGRKVNDARALLSLVQGDPSSRAARDELRRRLHALGAGARLLRFEAMNHALQEALAVLDRSAQAGTLRENDVTFVARVLDDLPALAWGEGPSRERSSRASADSASEPEGPIPIAVLVVGGEGLADALAEDTSGRARSFECERTDDIQMTLELARAHAPDLLIVDADLPGAGKLVESLLDDPLMDPVPVVVVGTFHAPEEHAKFVALGVARTLTRPVTPEVLRATCEEVVEIHEGPTLRMTLGEPTLEQLAERLSSEIRRGLVESVDQPARSHRIPLGEGTEVVGALWGAIARVQEIIVQRTHGAIRFGAQAPEGAIALAPSLHQDLPGADRFAGRGRGAAAEVRLSGRRVVVADDDPGVTWFVSDLLRTAGCEVHEALDGSTALDLAYRVQPELVISDILMPGLDGFALCRALRRDVALRDVPVILLSWKEDLLQRVRELGASAAAYMRKESGSRAILARVREVLRSRARIELRLRSEGEVRGRLDGLTPRLLLELVGSIRKDARLSIRDATHMHEVEIRAGAPCRATRTASDGSYLSGERALAGLLGVGAGRFVVTPNSTPIRRELTGTLAEQLVHPIAVARGALATTAGARLASVERIAFDEAAVVDYLSATPEPTRSLIQQLSKGISPRQMLLGGHVSPSLLEDVLSDLAARGAIQAVWGQDGVDLLTPAIDTALATMRGARESRPSTAPHASTDAAESTAPSVSAVASGVSGKAAPTETRPVIYESLVLTDPPPVAPKPDEQVPSSLEDAVIREISDRSFESHAARASAPDLPPIVEPSELRPRPSSDPPVAGDGASLRGAADEALVLPSFPPDAVVPAASSSEETAAAAPAVPAAPHPASGPTWPAHPPSVEAPGEDEDRAASASATPWPTPAPPASAPRSGRRRLGLWLAVGLVGVAVALALRHIGEAPAENSARSEGPAAVPAANVSRGESLPSVPFLATSEDNLPPGAEVPPGLGLLEVRAPPRAVVRIDGTVAGSGPFVASVASPGHHEVRIGYGGRETTYVVEVRTGKTTHVNSTSVQ